MRARDLAATAFAVERRQADDADLERLAVDLARFHRELGGLVGQVDLGALDLHLGALRLVALLAQQGQLDDGILGAADETHDLVQVHVDDGLGLGIRDGLALTIGDLADRDDLVLGLQHLGLVGRAARDDFLDDGKAVLRAEASADALERETHIDLEVLELLAREE